MGETVDQMAQTQRVEADQIVRILQEWRWVSGKEPLRMIGDAPR